MYSTTTESKMSMFDSIR